MTITFRHDFPKRTRYLLSLSMQGSRIRDPLRFGGRMAWGVLYQMSRYYQYSFRARTCLESTPRLVCR